MDDSDSDFYGDEDVVGKLQARVDRFDVDTWAEQQSLNPGRPERALNHTQNSFQLHNPYAGVPYAWQLTETLDEFFARLPPDTTSQSSAPWIYICNPFISRVSKQQSDEYQIKGMGNEDEAPSEEGSSLHILIQGGMERLGLVGSFAEDMSQMNKSKSFKDQELQKERRQAAADILSLAHAAKIRAGKWMIFCSDRDVNDTWEVVARATAANELGIAAKVSPRPEEDGMKRDRIICVYTADFSDKVDVGRVLQKLRELKLVEAKHRAVYYKPDAFTYIGIASGNPWGLKASLYSSWDAFPR